MIETAGICLYRWKNNNIIFLAKITIFL